MGEVTVTIGDLHALLPLLVVAATIVVAMLTIAVRRVHLVTAGLTVSGLVLAFASLFVPGHVSGRPVTPLFIMDGFGLSLMGLVILAGLVVALFSFTYLERGSEQKDEHYLMLLMAVLGAMVLTISSHLASFFLGLELLGVSLYGLIAYQTTRARGVEAGVKYFVLAAMATALVAFGIALIYADTGVLSLSALDGPRPPCRPGDAGGPGCAYWFGVAPVGHRFQAGHRPLPFVEPGCVPGCAGAHHGLHRHRLQGWGVRLFPPRRHHAGHPPQALPLYDHRAACRDFHVRGESSGIAAAKSQAPAGLFLHIAHGVSAHDRIGLSAMGHDGGHPLPHRLFHRHSGGLRRDHRIVSPRSGGRNPGRLPGPVLATAVAGTGPDVFHAVACRDPVDSRLHGKTHPGGRAASAARSGG